MNRCAICNKFRKWEELTYKEYDYAERDSCYSNIDEWYECKYCLKKQKEYKNG